MSDENKKVDEKEQAKQKEQELTDEELQEVAGGATNAIHIRSEAGTRS
jgi:bacteriocin-like protein